MYSGLLLHVRDLLIRVLDDRRKRVEDVETELGVRRPLDRAPVCMGNGISGGGGGVSRSALYGNTSPRLRLARELDRRLKLGSGALPALDGPAEKPEKARSRSVDGEKRDPPSDVIPVSSSSS